ncbi:C6 finger domain protein [Mycena crocata]|nr:C6 finger domain protein [Mycena crocata]
MTTPQRYRSKQSPTTRKKSCQHCSDAKARCSLQRPRCSRCQTRGLVCHYFTVDSPLVANDALTPSMHNSSPSAENAAAGSCSTVPANDSSDPRYQPITTLECPPTSESVRIGSRWLDALVPPPPGNPPKKFSPRTIQYMSRVLNSYATVMMKDEALPPIIHPFQSGSPQRPLANCRSLLRMWDGKAPGSELMVRETVLREMSKLFEEHQAYDHSTLLSACQAYLLYSIHFFFDPDSESPAMIDTTTIINLQELASAMSLTGMHSSDAVHRIRPTWESWIMAEAKRRTLYTMYMFDNVFNFSQNTDSYTATELGKLPLPSNKTLWAASTKDEWESEYERHVAAWPSSIPRLEDLWPHPVIAVAQDRRERADRWLESVDEFGMFMFAVSSITHG